MIERKIFRKKLLKRNRIGTKLLIGFLGISVIPVIILSYLSSSFINNTLSDNLIQNFSLIAEIKNDQISNYFSVQKKDIHVISHSPLFIEALYKFEKAINEHGKDSEEYSDVEKEYFEYLKFYADEFDYYDLFLINKHGDIVFTIAKEDDFNTNLITGDYKDTELAHVFKKALDNDDIFLSVYRHYPPSDQPASFLAAPIFKKQYY